MTGNGLPLYPVTVVGSWPRPTYLLDALHKRQSGQMTFDEFNTVADRAVLEALRYQEEAGVDIVSDRGQRRHNFYSFIQVEPGGGQLMSFARIMDWREDQSFFDSVPPHAHAPGFPI